MQIGGIPYVTVRTLQGHADILFFTNLITYPSPPLRIFVGVHCIFINEVFWNTICQDLKALQIQFCL